jgi:hypothetical protein
MRFFNHETKAHQDSKIRKVIRTHGVTGYGIYWLLLEKLYSEDDLGFQIQANELWIEDFAESLHISDYRVLIRVFDTFSEIGLISKQLWQDHILYSDAIAQRGDNYVQKKIYEREKKRKQRSVNQVNPSNVPNCPPDVPRDNLGHSENSVMSPSHIHIHNSDPKPDSNTFKEKSIYTVDDSDFEVFKEIWNSDRPKHWARCDKLDNDRITALKKFVKKATKERSLEIFQAALCYARSDRWCNKPDIKLTIDNFLTHNKPIGWAEKASSSDFVGVSVGNTQDDWLNALEGL